MARFQFQRRWWYIERPFPWLLITIYAAVPAAILVLLLLIGVIR